MATIDELRKLLDEFPEKTVDRERLSDLRAFLDEMKAAGIAKTREYDLPRPDTVGRGFRNSGPRSEVLPKLEKSEE